MRRFRGFTLIEVLVVIGIVLVLAAMLFPVFARARGNAHSASCVTRLSQIAKACRMYSDDYDRTIVPARTAVTVGGSRGITWCVLLQPYMKSQELLVCPADDAPRPSAQSVCLPHSYGINYLLSFNSRWGSYPAVVSLSHLQRTSDVICFFDMTGDVAEMGAGYYSHRTSRIAWRHHEAANFAFLDGHAKSLRADGVSAVRSWDPFVP